MTQHYNESQKILYNAAKETAADDQSLFHDPEFVEAFTGVVCDRIEKREVTAISSDIFADRIERQAVADGLRERDETIAQEWVDKANEARRRSEARANVRVRCNHPRTSGRCRNGASNRFNGRCYIHAPKYLPCRCGHPYIDHRNKRVYKPFSSYEWINKPSCQDECECNQFVWVDA